MADATESGNRLKQRRASRPKVKTGCNNCKLVVFFYVYLHFPFSFPLPFPFLSLPCLAFPFSFHSLSHFHSHIILLTTLGFPVSRFPFRRIVFRVDVPRVLLRSAMRNDGGRKEINQTLANLRILSFFPSIEFEELNAMSRDLNVRNV